MLDSYTVRAHPAGTEGTRRDLNVRGRAPKAEEAPALVGHSKVLGLPTAVNLHSNRVSANRNLGFRETEFCERRQKGTKHARKI